MAQSFRLDPIRCGGYGMCAEILPERIRLDDWGYPVIEPGPVPARLLAHARRAVDMCPTLALRLRNVESSAALPRSAPETREVVPRGQPGLAPLHPGEDGTRPRPRPRAAGA